MIHIAFRGIIVDNVVIMLSLLFRIAIAGLIGHSTIAAAQDLEADFDERNQFEWHSQWPTFETVAAGNGKAWRSDGFSSYLRQSATLRGDRMIAVSLSAALESYPSDLEVPVDQVTPSSFISQSGGNEGFNLWIDTYGRWGAEIVTKRGTISLDAPDRFPLYEWVRIGFAYDPNSGEAVLLRNGKTIAAEAKHGGGDWKPASGPVLVAGPFAPATALNFALSLLNGAFDDILITQDRARWQAAIPGQAAAAPPIEESLAVPASRFADDHLRPRYHAMPPANWTNEPHGLVMVEGRYHLFYQRTPNGPFKTQMVWGHMSSADLVDWTHHRDALRPELQTDSFGFDMKGIWSGDVIAANGMAQAYYTSVNHGPGEAYNPGISVALSTDPLLREWQKRGPIINTRHVEDFRDPYLWEEDGAWHMIIGAAYGSGGGLDYYTCDNIADPTNCWQRRRQFSRIPYSRMDVASIIWEMPVFEPLGNRHLLIVNPIGGAVSKYGSPATRGVYWLGGWQDGLFAPDAAAPRMLDLFPGHLSPTVARLPDGRLVGIGIVDERRTSQAQEDAGWAHTFSLPREYYLNAAGLLGQRPLAGLAALRGEHLSLTLARTGGLELVADPGHQYEAQVRFSQANGAQPFGLALMANADGSERTLLTYDPATRTMVLDKSASSSGGQDEGPQVLREAFDVAAFGDPLDWRIFVDGSVVDVFIGDGAAFSFRAYPAQRTSTGFGIIGSGGTARGTIWQLRPSAFDHDFSESPHVE